MIHPMMGAVDYRGCSHERPWIMMDMGTILTLWRPWVMVEKTKGMLIKVPTTANSLDLPFIPTLTKETSTKAITPTIMCPTAIKHVGVFVGRIEIYHIFKCQDLTPTYPIDVQILITASARLTCSYGSNTRRRVNQFVCVMTTRHGSTNNWVEKLTLQCY